MGDAKSIKERGILEQVIKSELDFITYVDVHTGTFHVIVTNDDTDVTPPPEGDYTPPSGGGVTSVSSLVTIT